MIPFTEAGAKAVSNVLKFPSATCNTHAGRPSTTAVFEVESTISEVERLLLIRTEPAILNTVLSFERVNAQVRRVIDCISDESARAIMLDQLARIKQQIGILRGKCQLSEDCRVIARNPAAGVIPLSQ